MSETQRHDASLASLFEDLPAEPEQQVMAAKQARAAARRQGPPRLLQPNRGQIELRASDLESLLGEDHRARLVWGYVERQDFKPADRGDQGTRQQRWALGRSTRASCLRCGSTPRWRAWAAGARLRG